MGAPSKRFGWQLFKRELPMERLWHHMLVVLFFSEIAFAFLTINKPPLEIDYGFYMSRLVSNRVYHQKNGWFHLPYYSPAFAGGCPNYGDPQDMTFSLLQFFFNYAPNPNTAVVLSFFVSQLLCYFGAYVFLRRFAIQRWLAGTGAFLFSINGFIGARWAVGHLTTSPIYWALPWVLANVHDLYHATTDRSRARSALWLALLISAIIYGAGIITLNLSAVLSLTLIAALCWRDRRRLPSGLAAFGAAAVGLAFVMTSSKWVAMLDFLSQFPRYTMNHRLSLQQIVWLLFHSYFDPTVNAYAQLPYDIGGAWEFSNYVGWTLLVVVLTGALVDAFRESASRPAGTETVRFFWMWLVILVPLTVYLIRGWNIGWMLVKNLPIIATNQGVFRFLGLLPIAWIALAMAYLNRLMTTYRKRQLTYLLCAALIADFMFYYAWMPLKGGMEGSFASAFPADVKNFRITRWTNDGGPETLARGVGNADVNNVVYGYGAVKSRVTTAQPPLHKYPDGTFNITDPVAMIYPDEAGHSPWSRLPVSVGDAAAEKFLAFEDPGFFVPARQKIANGLSLLSVLFALGTLASLYRRRHAS